MEERGYQLIAPEEDEPDKDSDVFYNRRMEMNRDLSFLAGKVFSDKIKPEKFVSCDPLAATGIRGFRYTEFSDKVKINDSNPSAVENIEKAAEINQIDSEIFNKDANVLMSDNWQNFHFLDLDPFGSFVPYLDSAARSLNYQSFLGVTATDKAVPAGTYRKTCLRRYSSKPIKESFMHETGIRIYIKKICEILSQYDKAFDPKVCFTDRHYTRIMGRVTESKQRCNNNLENIGELSFCPECRWRKLEGTDKCDNCGSSVRNTGPMWTGKIQDQRFTGKMLEEIPAEWEDSTDMLEMLDSEAELVTPYYDIHELCSNMGISAPRRDDVLQRIENKGYPVSRTHFSPNGFRTDAPIDQIKDIIRETS